MSYCANCECCIALNDKDHIPHFVWKRNNDIYFFHSTFHNGSVVPIDHIYYSNYKNGF